MYHNKGLFYHRLLGVFWVFNSEYARVTPQLPGTSEDREKVPFQSRASGDGVADKHKLIENATSTHLWPYTAASALTGKQLPVTMPLCAVPAGSRATRGSAH